MPHSQISTHDKEVLDRIFNPLTPYDDPDYVDEDDQQEGDQGAVVSEVKGFEVEAARAAEKGDIDTALALLNKAIDKAPDNASCYNNRAQALRLAKDINGALSDLDRAIELSGGKGKVACQAFTQRAIIYKLQERNDESLEDFKSAASLGSQFAKQQVALANPYAAMCNQMMCEMIGKVKAGKM